MSKYQVVTSDENGKDKVLPKVYNTRDEAHKELVRIRKDHNAKFSTHLPLGIILVKKG